VQIKKENWLLKDPGTTLSKWRANAHRAILNTWEVVKAAERRIYSDKSYFVHKEQRKGKGRGNAELASDNKVIELSSDDGLERPYNRTATTKGKDKAVDDPETGELGEGHEDEDNDNADAGGDLGDDRGSVEL
jgi:hypothetical protein